MYLRRIGSDAPPGRIGTIGSGMSSGTTPVNQHGYDQRVQHAPELECEQELKHEGSTNLLIRRYRGLWDGS
jgi:hypothetical protein